jgi:hypothetical protein
MVGVLHQFIIIGNVRIMKSASTYQGKMPDCTFLLVKSDLPVDFLHG